MQKVEGPHGSVGCKNQADRSDRAIAFQSIQGSGYLLQTLVQLVFRQYNFLTYCLTESCSSLVDGITGCVWDSRLEGQRIICRFLSVTLAVKGQMMETSMASQNRNICQACALIHIPAQGSHALAFRRPMLALDFNHPPVIKVEPIPVPLSVPLLVMFINKTKWLCVTQRALQVGV